MFFIPQLTHFLTSLKVKLSSDTNEEVIVQRRYIHHNTGAPLMPSDIVKYQEYGGKKIKVTQDEAKGRVK